MYRLCGMFFIFYFISAISWFYRLYLTTSTSAIALWVTFLKLIYIDNYYILATDHEAFRIAKYVILLK